MKTIGIRISVMKTIGGRIVERHVERNEGGFTRDNGMMQQPCF